MNILLDWEDRPLPDWYLDAGASWEKINSYVLNLREKKPQYPIWRAIERFPISKDFIDQVIKDKWKVVYKDLTGIVGGVTRENEIYLARYLAPYPRDITLFHELVHIRHPYFLSSQTTNNRQEKCEREIITEWLGRKARTDPDLLRHVVLSFGLDAHVYDKPSYEAFQGLRGQQYFPFMRQEYTVKIMN